MSLRPHFAFLAAFLLLASPRLAPADLTLTFSQATDGGVILDITGSGTYLAGGVEGNLFLGNVGDFLDFTTGGDDIFADSISGHWLHNGSPVDVTLIAIDKDLPNVGGDDIVINYSDGSLGTGTYEFALSARWLVGTLSFTRLIPGSYGPGTTADSLDFNPIKITVASGNMAAVPEPGLPALFLSGSTLALLATLATRNKPAPARE